MPATSRSQQRFMGMVRATQKGAIANPLPKVARAANSMSKDDVKDFAATKHKGLPEKAAAVTAQSPATIFAEKLAYSTAPGSPRPLDHATQVSSVGRPQTAPRIGQRKVTPVPPAAADARATTPARKPTPVPRVPTQQPVVPQTKVASSHCRTKAAPSYSAKGKKGKKTMPQPHAVRTKTAATIFAEKLAVAPASNELLDMESNSGRLADLTHGWGGERAGRAQAMATASGDDAPLSVRHPGTVRALKMLLGGGMGGLAGYGLANAVGGPASLVDERAGLGTALGSLLGSGAALGMDTLSRRDQFRDISDKYDVAREAGTLSPSTPQFSALAGILAPLRGPHRTGQLEASRAMKGGPAIKDQRGLLRDLAYAASIPTRGASDLIHGYAQNARTAAGARKDRKKDRELARDTTVSNMAAP